MKLDILVFAAHPDDAELCCSGTLAAHVAAGYQCGIVDMTRGEMGTRGTPGIRMQEAEEAARILGIQVRENLGFADTHFSDDWEHRREVVKMIRKYRPEIVLASAIRDRHPDHAKAAQLVKQAFFQAGLKKITTESDGVEQDAYRPRRLFHYIQNDYIDPDIIVDISDFWDKKYESIRAFKTQFHNPDLDAPDTFISSPEFMEFIEARAKVFGHRIGVKYGEGFTLSVTPGVKDLFSII